jgi:hypothetical protein
MKIRDYQERIANDAAEVLERKKIVCIFAEVRCGKTIMALQTCHLAKAKKVLFITKIKAFSSIQKDYDNMNYSFELIIINRESLHKIETNDFDIIIIDEVHGYSSYPKPSVYAKEIKKRFGNIPMIMLSGTPTPESYSQYYHIFWLSNHSPFSDYPNFYKWANEYVNIKLRYLGYAQVKDYSDARKKDFWHRIRYYILTFTQKEAGFTTTVNENILECQMKPITYKIIEKLHKDLVVKSSDGKLILGDTGVKLQQKTHQLFSGTIKFEDGTTRVIDASKAEFIKDKFKGYKIGIFYKFIAELEMLRSVFKEKLTTDLTEFDTTDKNIALQIVSGREGISLRNADHLVFMNIDFSAVSYFQAKDRMTTLERKENTIFWIFSKDGIEEKIYKTVQGKKDYTNSTFKKDFNVKLSNENNKTLSEKRSNRFKYN